MGRLQEGQNALHVPKVVGKPNFTQVPRKGEDMRRPTLRQSSFNPANAVQAESNKAGATRNLPRPGQECLARSRSINARSGDKASTTSFFLQTFRLDCGIMAIASFTSRSAKDYGMAAAGTLQQAADVYGWTDFNLRSSAAGSRSQSRQGPKEGLADGHGTGALSQPGTRAMSRSMEGTKAH